jgi:hypothetical protein
MAAALLGVSCACTSSERSRPDSSLLAASDAGVASTPELVGPDAGTAPAPSEELPVPRLVADGCPRAEPLHPEYFNGRSILRVSGSTSASSSLSESPIGGCRGATAGPETWYELDLGSSPGPLEFRAVLDAQFDAAVELRRGACGDTLSLDCDRASALGRPSSVLTARLDPGSYWLVVEGAGPEESGSYELQIELDDALGDCPVPPVNDSCETAQPLASLPHQTVLFELGCAQPDAEPALQHDRFFELDLSDEPAPVLAQVSVWSERVHGGVLYLYQAASTAAGCGSEWVHAYNASAAAYASEAEFEALLPPARYVLEIRTYVDEAELRDRSALTLGLDRTTCANGPLGGSCETALELDPNQSVQLREGTTLCNADQLSIEYCGEPGTPDQFHRLDLRDAARLTRLRAEVLTDGLTLSPVLAIIRGNADGGCAAPLYCFDSFSNAEGPPRLDLLLQPELYFVVVGGADAGSAGRYRLLVELEPGQASACVTPAIEDCVRQSQLSCCGLSAPECDQIFAACGLDAAVRACVCSSNPACCGAEGDASTCPAVHAQCQYICPEVEPQVSRCVRATEVY